MVSFSGSNICWMLAFVCSSALTSVEAARCFQCNAIPYPTDCMHITTCAPQESCYTEKYTTERGSVLYNIGCQSKLNCDHSIGPLVGKREVDRHPFIAPERSRISDPRNRDNRQFGNTTCTECCQGDTCNNKGCNSSGISSHHSGQYCFTCESEWNPTACKRVSICIQDEVCVIYGPRKDLGIPEHLYQSSCDFKQRCRSLHPLPDSVPHSCCDLEFCINQLKNYTLIPRNTAAPEQQPVPNITTTTTTTTTTTSIKIQSSISHLATHMGATKLTPQDVHCNSSSGYFSLPVTSSTSLCINVHEDRETWDDARKKCQGEGADLLVVDTQEKARALDKYIYFYAPFGSYYWVGATDKYRNNTFYWVNGEPVTFTDWDTTDHQPDSISNADGENEDCIKTSAFNVDHDWHDETADKYKLIMLNNHTSISFENNRILPLGGGGNFFICNTSEFIPSHHGHHEGYPLMEQV